MQIIAKAYGDEPIQRIATGFRGSLIYLLHPSIVSAVGITPFSGVGFPEDSVFQFDLDVFDSLCEAWRADDPKRLEQAWRRAIPFRKDDRIAA